MRLIAVGRMKDSHERALVERYLKRLNPPLTITELPDGKGSPAEIKRREGEAILSALPDRAFVVVLDLAGKLMSSEVFSQKLGEWTETGRDVCFIIGGAEGLDAAVVVRADASISLGSFTWPHMLVRIMVVEQIYRARAIATGHPYHRSGRP
ncbi:23S rRNA (pseudouridine(1915)-N(3))-methyltransferase RlmH [Acetobacter sp.]|jgi:23S rRNA (pseudouridine1915-N3)-methyltransferase|uniref:23S rRNA (pseudouridine(1915)-N(3))-methyltransferase RlmH n=1 Tax=Acetobacter sp. TaxID=440 RepID=UPI0025B8A265|nr:23S rRNA (pseudouridine(1915)-N(3))-methyltransferase RlmH [Acetobacter sp.]MCH4090414.1 23S rRNA (pseudouridine(1915)-N(3))-methyltransferase RlmH [Acetobacter sp.]MCI1299108.1 23S rRNA (pseudouridine(1915)-N(3))-methyltransferase RlmH [Acetobacter sp.]MCI1315655.1 23S rRNA (pseudouridine(1915)-N(3))-methyltransferase RlmH [Acetobacter sp.]